MIVNGIVKKMIIEQEDEKLPDAIRLGAPDGMQDFNMSLKDLVDRDLIDQETALEVSPNPQQLKMVLKGIDVSQGGLI